MGPKGHLRLMTWNIWFREVLQEQRMEELLAYVKHARPDVIGFQELTKELRGYLERPGGALASYARVETGVERQQGYWEGLYTLLPVGEGSARCAYIDSGMGRGVTILHCPQLDLVVGTTHLESMFYAQRRQLQAEEALSYLDAYETQNAVFMGDMNLHDGQELDAILPPGWVDAWAALRPEDPGYTYDAARNTMIFESHRERIDRIYVRCSQYSLKDIRLLGTTPMAGVEGAKREVYPSDHFGLLLELELPG